MLAHLRFESILFLDIETVPQQASYDALDNTTQKLWQHKSKFIQKEAETYAETYQRAAIYAEFGKVVCISIGFSPASAPEQPRSFRIKSFAGTDEKLLLQQFCDLLNERFSSEQYTLCAHNGKEFDFPYLARRILINQLKLPDLLNIAGLKPWEVRHLDTMVLWKFGDFKNYTSIAILAHVFNIPTPKDDIDGSQVAEVYYQDQDLARIVRYCEKDTLTVAQLLLAYKGEPFIEEEQVISV